MRIFSLIAVLLVGACTSFKFAVVNLPSHFDGVRVTHNAAFGPENWQRLDIYAPAEASPDHPFPVIVFYYGGRWEAGDKGDYAFVGSALARRNFIVVVPNYRKYPQVKFPVFVDDAAQALAWVDRHIGAYGGQKGPVHIAGHSAGAHIASLLAADARYLKKYGLERSDVVRDFTGLAGPYDFTPEDPDLKDMFGPPAQYSQMQATTFIDGRQPPMLLLWGADDTAVKRENLDRLAAAIHERGGVVETKIYPGVDHVWLLANLSWLGVKDKSVLEDWVGFMGRER